MFTAPTIPSKFKQLFGVLCTVGSSLDSLAVIDKYISINTIYICVCYYSVVWSLILFYHLFSGPFLTQRAQEHSLFEGLSGANYKNFKSMPDISNNNPPSDSSTGDNKGM
jgi:hypothetical protein